MYRKAAKYRVKIQKLIAFFHISNEKLKGKIKKYKIILNKIKYLGIKLYKYMYVYICICFVYIKR